MLRTAESRALLLEEAALEVFAFLADVERGDRPVIAHHSRPNFTALALAVVEHDFAGFEMALGHIIHVVLLE